MKRFLSGPVSAPVGDHPVAGHDRLPPHYLAVVKQTIKSPSDLIFAAHLAKGWARAPGGCEAATNLITFLNRRAKARRWQQLNIAIRDARLEVKRRCPR